MKKSKKTPIKDEIELSKNVIDDIDESSDDLKELKELLGEGEYKVSVYRLSNDGTQWEKIGQFPLDQFNPDEIAKSYGGGKFKFRVVDTEGKFVRQMTVPYAIIKQEQKDNKKDDLLEFIKTELSSRDMLLSKIIENLKPPQQQTNLTELITALSTLKSMEKTQSMDFSDMLNVLKMGFNMTKELQENVVSEPESVENKFINTMIDKLLPSLGNILSGGTYHKIPQNKPPLPPLQNQQKVSYKQEVNYISPFEKTLVDNFRMYEKAIMAQSISKDNIPNVVNIILQMLSDDDILLLEKYLKEYSYHRIINFIPSLAPAKDWLKLLVDELLKTIDTMTTNDDTDMEAEDVELEDTKLEDKELEDTEPLSEVHEE